MSTMQKIFAFTLIWLSAAFIVSSTPKTVVTTQTGDRTILITHRPHTPTGNAPRSITENPFSAELLDMGVLLFADSDWGDAEVTLSSVEGDYYYTVFDTSDGAIVLPTNGDIGDSYTITIVTSGGLIFEGEFYL